ncbi:MAG: HEPN domain-containing protein [Planctomycetota bacterium]
MSPGEPSPGSAQHWLARSAGHLAIARQPKPPEGYWEDLAFHAHQAAELALKAVYQHHGLLFRFTHNLGELATGLEKSGIPLSPAVKEAAILTRFAVQTRYPGLSAPATQEEHERAVRIAEGVVDWARRIIGQ